MQTARLAVITLLVLPFICTQTARADMGTPGFKRIDQRVIFDNLDEYPTFVFFLTSTMLLEVKDTPKFRLSEGEIVELGYAVRYRLDWQVVAVPRGEVEKAGSNPDLESLVKNGTGVLHSDTFQFPDYESAIVLNPKQYNLYRYHIEISDASLSARLVSVTSVGSGETWLWIVGLIISLVVASAGIWWGRRRMRRRSKTA